MDRYASRKTMNKNLLLTLLSAVSIGTLSSRAQTGATVTAPTVTATVAAVNQYMFRGQRLSGGSLQPSVELGMGNGALGIWVNKPISEQVPNSSDPEFDFYGSYK